MGVEFLKIKESEEAKEIIQEKFDELYSPQSEIIDIADSYERITFSDIKSRIDFPPFEKSALEHLFQMAPMLWLWSSLQTERATIQILHLMKLRY